MKKRYIARYLTKHYTKSTAQKTVYAWVYGGKFESVEAARKFWDNVNNSEIYGGIDLKDTTTGEIVFKKVKNVEVVKI